MNQSPTTAALAAARAIREDAYNAAFLLRARGHNNGYADAHAAYAVADIAYAAAVKAAIAASK